MLPRLRPSLPASCAPFIPPPPVCVYSAGLELTFGPSPGDARIDGPSPAQRDLTDGHHGVEILVTVYEYQGEPYISSAG